MLHRGIEHVAHGAPDEDDSEAYVSGEMFLRLLVLDAERHVRACNVRIAHTLHLCANTLCWWCLAWFWSSRSWTHISSSG